MRYSFFVLLLSSSLSLFSQDDNPEIHKGAFYKLSLAGTVTTNEDIDLADDYNDNLFEFDAFFLMQQ